MSKHRLARTSYFIGSGKGGVGKSTIAVNLAVALAKKGLRVGLLDADLYGPSIPIMFGLRGVSPKVLDSDEKNPRVIPITKFGVHCISLGFFLEEARAIVWRGPMLHSMLQKFIQQVSWGDLDFLLVDLPPGTGDIPLSLTQTLEIDGILVVSTPQQVAQLDAIKAINACEQLDVPLKGVIENMSGFQIPGSDEKLPIFGEGAGADLAMRFHSELLAQIPLDLIIRRGGDEGVPFACRQDDNPAIREIQKLSDAVAQGKRAEANNPFL
jgi:ATP-binding protein involved in chromosome partitioning